MIVDPADPEFAGRAARVKLLGIDFDGVMTDNRVYVFEDGREAVVCSRLEGYGLRRLSRIGVRPLIVSTEINSVVGARADKLKIECVQAVEDKVTTLAALLNENGLNWSQAAFIGNDINDMGVLQRVGLPVAVADAHECLNDLTVFRTKRIGGQGAVRELCDAIALVLETREGR